MADFNELLKTRRSIRAYEEREVALDLVKEIILDSVMAPSSSNNQPWHFIIVNNRELMRNISDESKKNLLDDIRKNPDGPGANYQAVLENKNFNVFYNAPCLVILAGPASQRSLAVDLALCASYFMFSAASRGLGTCWVNLGSVIRDPALKQKLGLPEGFAVVAPIILGHPKMIPTPPPRNHPLFLSIIE